MAFAFIDDTIGSVDPQTIDTTGPGPGPTSTGATFGRMNFYQQEQRAYDLTLGAATLMYMRYSGTIAAGTVCEITPTLSGTTILQSATAWAGTVKSGRPLAIALVAGTVGQWGWFIVQGNAVVTSQGAPAAGNPAYWQAAGVVSPTLVAGAQVNNAVFAVAPSTTVGTGNNAIVLSATQAILAVNRPFAQGNIT